ncbi:MAG: AI-2E family transporter [Oliverpabstia sp.]|nr:AI-2E family transporter [Oliverpabstia sp.]
MELSKDNMKKIMLLIVFTVLILVGVTNVNKVWGVIKVLLNIIFPFILGGAIAFIINMPMRCIEKNIFKRGSEKYQNAVKKIARPISLVLSLVLILAVVGLVFFVVVPQLGDTVIRLSNDIRQFWPQVQEWAIRLFEDNPDVVDWINSIEINWDKIVQGGIEFLKTGAGTILGSTYSVAKTIVSAATNFVIAFVFAVYIVLQKEKLSVQVSKIMYAFLPEKVVEKIQAVCLLTHKTFSNFLTGQCLEAVILGSMFFVVMVVFSFPYPLLVGVLIAFTALIPIFGAFIGCFVGTFLILMENPMQAIAFVAIFLILQQIEGNLIYPHVVGSSVGLPSIWVLVAVTLGASVMGIVGMLVFIPLLSVIYTLFRGYVYKRLKSRKLLAKAERSHNS